MLLREKPQTRNRAAPSGVNIAPPPGKILSVAPIEYQKIILRNQKANPNQMELRFWFFIVLSRPGNGIFRKPAIKN